MKDLAPLLQTPDFAVLSEPQVIALTGMSRDTLYRLRLAGDGPPRVQLSPRRSGYQVGPLKDWLAKRST